MLYQKREQVNELEKSTGYFNKKTLNSTKEKVTKLEELQSKVKKAFRVLDGKPTVNPTDEATEHALLKSFRAEMT